MNWCNDTFMWKHNQACGLRWIRTSENECVCSYATWNVHQLGITYLCSLLTKLYSRVGLQGLASFNLIGARVSTHVKIKVDSMYYSIIFIKPMQVNNKNLYRISLIISLYGLRCCHLSFLYTFWAYAFVVSFFIKHLQLALYVILQSHVACNHHNCNIQTKLRLSRSFQGHHTTPGTNFWRCHCALEEKDLSGQFW